MLKYLLILAHSSQVNTLLASSKVLKTSTSTITEWFSAYSLLQLSLSSLNSPLLNNGLQLSFGVLDEQEQEHLGSHVAEEA